MQIKTLAKAMLIALVVMIAVPSQHLSAQVSQAPMGEKMKKGRPKFNPKEIEKKLRKHLSKAADLSPEEQAVVFPIAAYTPSVLPSAMHRAYSTKCRKCANKRLP